MELMEQTIQLKEQLEQLKERYENNSAPANKRDKNFFEMVKKETKPVYDLVGEWEKNALIKVKQRHVQVHPQQVSSTRENMELLIMHSYYIDVKRKRYMELNHSVRFICDRLMEDCRE